MPRDVETYCLGATLGEGDGFGAEVALKVENVESRQFAEVFPFEGSKPAGRIGGIPALETVVPAGDMDGGTRVPVELVGSHHVSVVEVEFS